jgi:branched-chain amino acid transport system permease protein
VGVLAVLPLIPPFDQDYLTRWLIVAIIMGASAVSFDFAFGCISVINFGFMSFFGLGGYTSALMAINFGLSPWITVFFGALAGALMGFLTGATSLRLRGAFILAFTWFIGYAMMGLATKMVFLTRGSAGLICPLFLKTTSNLPYYYVILVMLLVTYIVLKSVARSNIGLAFRAIGQNMEAARTSGIYPVRYRILNFTLSCGFAGWLGGFYAHYYGVLTPDVMGTARTTEVLVIACIGGKGSLWGGAIAAIPFTLSMEIIRSSFSNLPGINLIIYGVFLILLMISYPGGLAQLYQNFVVKSES